MRGVPRMRRAISIAPSFAIGAPRTRAPRADDQLEFVVGIEIEADRDAETVAQRIGQQAGARGGADERELGEIDAGPSGRRDLRR